MKVAVYQFAPKFGSISYNLDKIESALEDLHADLFVLPELCTTGYQFISKDEVRTLCEPIPTGTSIQRLIKICLKKQCFMIAGIGELDGDICYNSAVLIGPEGYRGVYRKVHLFYEEKTWFQPGNVGFPVWDIGIARIGMMVCFDWIFPESARTLALQGADIICHPANLVLPYCQDATVTRSIENGVFSVLANRTGVEKRGDKKRLTFTGGSEVVTPRGKILFRLGQDTEEVTIVEINPEQARDKQITENNHLMNDRKTKYYRLG